MKVLSLIILLLLALQPELYGQNSVSSSKGLVMRIDSVYSAYARPKFDSTTWYAKYIQMSSIEYGYYVDNIPTGHKMTVRLNAWKQPTAIDFGFKFKDKYGKSVVSKYLNCEMMMEGLDSVMSDLNRKYDLSLFGSLHFENQAFLLFGDAVIELCKEYEDGLHGKKYNGELLHAVYKNSRLLREFKRIMSAYGKEVYDIDIEEVYCYPMSRKLYVEVFKYPGNVKDLPKGFVIQHDLTIAFRNKNEPL